MRRHQQDGNLVDGEADMLMLDQELGVLLVCGAGRKQWYELRSTESVPQTRGDNEA